MKLFLPVEHSNIHVDYRGLSTRQPSAVKSVRRIRSGGLTPQARIG